MSSAVSIRCSPKTVEPRRSFFQARTLPLGFYATDNDFDDGRLQNQAFIQRAALAVQRALPFFELARGSAFDDQSQDVPARPRDCCLTVSSEIH